MYKQHIDSMPMQITPVVKMVKCETTGTIYYTDGKTKSFSREAFLKSPNQIRKDVYESSSKK
tara:strand:- start:131 stop:316 length:186 start_codon:yes stop_codon:yes gene_type:complete